MIGAGLPPSERAIVDSFTQALPQPWRGSFVLREVPSHGRAHTDVVILLSRQMVGVEVKRTAWSRALVQAVLNRHTYDASYIALWHLKVNQRVLVDAARWGIGVVSIEGGRSRIVQRATLGRPDPETRRRMRSMLEARAEQIGVIAA